MKLLQAVLLVFSFCTAVYADPTSDAAALCLQHASQPIPENLGAPPIGRLAACIPPVDRVIIPQHVDLAFLGVGQCLQSISTRQTAMTQCASERVKAAVEAAGTNVDLKDAVKAFYIKQQALIDAFAPKGTDSKMSYRMALNRAMSESDEAWSKVQLEAKLAGTAP